MAFLAAIYHINSTITKQAYQTKRNKQNGVKYTDHTPLICQPLEPVAVNFCFMRGLLRICQKAICKLLIEQSLCVTEKHINILSYDKKIIRNIHLLSMTLFLCKD